MDDLKLIKDKDDPYNPWARIAELERRVRILEEMVNTLDHQSLDFRQIGF